MKATFLRLATAFLVWFVASISQAIAASGYDLTDHWSDPQEPGWGIELVQQRDVIFVGLFVHGNDGRPIWYTGALAFQGLEPQTHQITYRGDLYEARATWFGAVPFTLTSVRPVGTMSIVAPTMTTATLTYSVDGVTRSKAILRYTFRWDDYDGAYSGVQSLIYSKCSNPADDGTRTVAAGYTFSLSGTQMTVLATDSARSCTYAGPYRQDGRLGRIDANYSCSNGEVGAMALEEMSVQRFAVMGKLFGANNRGCHIEGSFAAVLQ